MAVVLPLLMACSSLPAGFAPTDSVNAFAWTRVGEDPWRETADGLEAGPAPVTGYLVSPQRYGDFRLSVEYWIEDGTNSGVLVRCKSQLAIDPVNCIEVNIWDNHPNQSFRTGAAVTLAEPLAHIVGLGRWVRIEIVANGDHVTASFDSQTTVDLRPERGRQGFIALQYAGQGVVKFRGLRINSSDILKAQTGKGGPSALSEISE